MSTSRPVPLFIALIPIVFLVFFLAANVLIFGDATLDGSNQIILLLAAAVTALIAHFQGVKWKKTEKAILHNIGKAMSAILILLLIGSLAGTWLLSGVVPAMVYYGLQIIHPKVFLLTAIVVSGLVSLATGSSWSTIATIGVALLGIGKALGMHEGLVAGAIISGAYFGDKMSPLSDTTNLAPAIAGTDLFTHIRYMTITTAPSLIIAVVIFTVIGFLSDFGDASQNIDAVMHAVEKEFFISPVLLLVPVILILIIIKKIPPVPALLTGALLGGLFAIIFQPQVIRNISGTGGSYALQSYASFMKAMFGDISIDSDNPVVHELFKTSGMRGMLNTVWLILTAMIFGGTMEAAGFLARISRAIMSRVHSTGSLILSTISTSIFFNLTASDQYISIVVPGHMYAKSYQEKGLKPEVLSRTLEDGGTLTSVLVPWNTCGATQSRVLGVSTWTYLPYCFFNLINPLVAVAIGYMGYKIRKIDPEDKSGKSSVPVES
ncbi:MAG: Na+/H+ antiporter NhaC [Bacteroidales bacterium]|nr:Na+/H+ antiporter NhaC [Bacteroidales bacterium]